MGKNVFETKAFLTKLYQMRTMLIYNVVVGYGGGGGGPGTLERYLNIALVVVVNDESICFTFHLMSLTLQPYEYRMVVII